jgi:polyadenylation factor subunit 2
MAAHDDAVNTLSFHPLGHILCSGSKDFTARFWCRARPVGGQEVDRWHVGEERAAEARLEEAQRERDRETRGIEEVVGGLPGLPGLGEQRMGGSGYANGGGVPGLGGALPGFGGMPPPQSVPQNRWGGGMTGDGPSGGSGMRSAAPLLSQEEMLRQTGAPTGRGYGGNSGQGSQNYGGYGRR